VDDETDGICGVNYVWMMGQTVFVELAMSER
jgi:hypothetical protein